MNLAEQYIDEVVNDEIVVCDYVRAAVNRHLTDLDHCEDYWFDHDRGEQAISFAQALRHTSGKWAGKPFSLQPWQAFVLYMIFGWVDDQGLRRFHKIYLEVARKNGKSEFSSVIQIIALLLDNEAAAEIYSAATKHDQAKIVFQKTRSMLRRLSGESDYVSDQVEVRKHDILRDSNDSFIKAINSDSHTLDGLNPHCAIIDEYHAHKNSDLLDVIESGMGARQQPILFIITTAGFNVEGPCYALRKNMIDILEGRIESDREFAIIYTLDKEDDWQDPEVWPKSNPNLNKSVYLNYLKAQFKQAKNQGGQKEVSFKTKNLNIWVNSSDTWITDEEWMACDFGEPIHDRKPVYLGVDIASTRDITAIAELYPPHEKSARFRVRMHYYIPEDSVDTKRKSGEAPYRKWVDDGLIKTTPGNHTDQAYIEEDILQINDRGNLKAAEFDPYNTSYLMTNLTDKGVPVSPFRQGFLSMSEPTKKLETMILSKELDHGGDPVLRWMMSNVALKHDPAGNIKVDKAKSQDKVDGVVALIMAIGGYLTEEIEENPYKNRGMLYV